MNHETDQHKWPPHPSGDSARTSPIPGTAHKHECARQDLLPLCESPNLPHFRAGQPLTPHDLNRLVAAVRALSAQLEELRQQLNPPVSPPQPEPVSN